MTKKQDMIIIFCLVSVPVIVLSFFTCWKTFSFYQKTGQKKGSIFAYKDLKSKIKNNFFKNEELEDEAERIIFLIELTWFFYLAFFVVIFVL